MNESGSNEHTARRPLAVAELPPAPVGSPSKPAGDDLLQRVRDGRLRPESYPGEWRDRRRAARRRSLRRGLAGWAAALAILSVCTCTASVAVTAGGLVGYAGYNVYRLVEGGRSWSMAAYDFLFTARPQPAPSGQPEQQAGSEPPARCPWTSRLLGRC